METVDLITRFWLDSRLLSFNHLAENLVKIAAAQTCCPQAAKSYDLYWGLEVIYVVSCDDRDSNAREFLQYPSLIAEVISPSTEKRDRRQKFRNYRAIETLQEYLIIDCDRPSLEIYRRNQNNNWELIHIFIDQLDFVTTNPEIDLTSINLHFSLAELYENIEFLP